MWLQFCQKCHLENVLLNMSCLPGTSIDFLNSEHRGTRRKFFCILLSPPVFGCLWILTNLTLPVECNHCLKMWRIVEIAKFHVVFFFNKFIYLFVYFWLRWVFIAASGLSLVAAGGGYSSLQCEGFSLQWLLLWSTGSRHTGFSSCGTRAQ